MRVRDITINDLAEFIRLEEGQWTEKEMEIYLAAAKDRVKSYTGLSEDEMDEKEDITLAVMVLVQDFYENRSYYTDKANQTVNHVIDSILGSYRRNLL